MDCLIQTFSVGEFLHFPKVERMGRQVKSSGQETGLLRPYFRERNFNIGLVNPETAMVFV